MWKQIYAECLWNQPWLPYHSHFQDVNTKYSLQVFFPEHLCYGKINKCNFSITGLTISYANFNLLCIRMAISWVRLESQADLWITFYFERQMRVWKPGVNNLKPYALIRTLSFLYTAMCFIRSWSAELWKRRKFWHQFL